MPHNQNDVEMDKTILCTSCGPSMVREVRKATEQQRQSSSCISPNTEGTLTLQ